MPRKHTAVSLLSTLSIGARIVYYCFRKIAQKKEVSKRMYFLGYRISENRITLCIKKIFFKNDSRKRYIQKTMTEQSTVFEVSHGAL